MRPAPVMPSRRPGNLMGGLIFCIASVFFLAVSSFVAWQQFSACRGWTPTPCTMLAASVDDGPDGSYLLTVRYRYEAGGTVREGRAYGANESVLRFDSVSEKAALLERFAPGTTHQGLVNPADPVEAVLVPPSPSLLPLLPFFLFPAVFFCVGLSFLLGALRKRRGPPAGYPAQPPDMPSLRSPDGGNARRTGLAEWLPTGFGVLFMAAGIGICLFGLRGKTADFAARGWPTVVATVQRTEVVRSWETGSKNRGGHYEFEPYLAYAYEAEGRRFEGDRYSFLAVKSRDPAAAAAVVAAHPVGSKIQVRVKPGDPAQSVFVVGPEMEMGERFLSWLPVLLGAAFALFGLVCLSIGASAMRRARRADPRNLAAPPPPGGVPLKDGRVKDFVSVAVFAVIWNVISWSFAAALWFSRAGLFERLFLIPFCLIGLGTIFLAIRNGLHLLAPRLRLVAPRPFLSRGTETTLSYALSGSMDGIRELRVDLVGVYVTIEGHGKGAQRIESEKQRIEALRVLTPHEMREGYLTVAIPSDAPETLGDTIGFRWRFEVELRCAHGRPVRDKIAVVVV